MRSVDPLRVRYSFAKLLVVASSHFLPYVQFYCSRVTIHLLLFAYTRYVNVNTQGLFIKVEDILKLSPLGNLIKGNFCFVQCLETFRL